MPSGKRTHPTVKEQLHPRNKHRARYDFAALVENCPELSPFVTINNYDDESIDFSDPMAVKMLNKALLIHFYAIENWDIPSGYLCPPIPGRADYIHNLADLAGQSWDGRIPTGSGIHCLDIGVGANCIYPIIGCSEYGWSFTGSDIDSTSIEIAEKIVDSNSGLKGKVILRMQRNPENIFEGIIKEDELFDTTMCNPPFHSSAHEAQLAASRKVTHLQLKKVTKPTLNFGGQSNELWFPGGEGRFIREMILQSKSFANSCFWFTTLVSKQSSLKTIEVVMKRVAPTQWKSIPMGQGNKKSRMVAWTYLSKVAQKRWMNARWTKNNNPL